MIGAERKQTSLGRPEAIPAVSRDVAEEGKAVMDLPLTPRLKQYSGNDPEKRRKAAERNAMAQRVVDHLNRLIAANPSETQSYAWAFVARDLKLTAEQVESSVAYGGNNGITIKIGPEDRPGLDRYKD